jgi:DNA repair protein SbcC/Rad50
MIKSLEMKNFKSHKHSKLIFHKGINAIVGEGMAGKSNILRAIEKIRLLKPINKRWRSNFAKAKDPTFIKMKMKEDIDVKLILGSDSKFIVYDRNKKKKLEFRKFGRTVPAKIASVLNIRAINVQKQLDQPYLVLDPPPSITREINKITNINMVDSWIKIINENSRSYDFLLKDLLSEKYEIKKKLKRLENLEEIEPTINKLDAIEQKLHALEIKAFEIESAIANIYAAEKKIERLEKALQAVDIVDQLKIIDRKMKKKKKDMEEIESFIYSNKNLSKLKEVFFDLTNRFFEELKNKKKCPVCLSEIGSKLIRKIKNEYYSNIGHSCDK